MILVHPLKKDKVVGAIGLLGGLVYSQITKSEAISVLQMETHLLHNIVLENILKIAENDWDNKLLII